MNKINKIKEEFYLKSKNNAFYSENKFNEALYRLTNFVDEYFFHLISNLIPDISNIQVSLRFSYMSIIKKIYRFISNNDDEIDLSSLKKDIKPLFDEIEDAKIFNRIRNSFDRVKTGTMSAKILDGVVSFDYVNIRNINSDLYSRWVDHEKPFLNHNISEHESTVRSFKDLFDKQYKNLWDHTNNLPKNKHKATLIYKNCYERMVDELLDIKEDIEFNEFTLDEFRRVYSAIQAIGIIKSNNYIYNILNKKDDNHNPSVEMDYDKFINYLSSLSDVNLDITTSIVNMLIYDEKFHEDKVSIYQPIFKNGNNIFYSTMLTYYSLLQEKILYYLNKMKNNQPAITKIARLREKLMIENIREFIVESSNLQVADSYILFENNKPSAEFDLVILDNNSKNILVCELKWFIKNDGELDLLNIDKKLVESITIRSNRLEKFIDNKKTIIKSLFNYEIDEDYEIFGCVISENHSGSANIDDKLPVFDRFAFYFSLDSVDYNLKEFHKIIKEDDYLPIPPYEIEYETFEYHNQKFRCPLLKYRI